MPYPPDRRGKDASILTVSGVQTGLSGVQGGGGLGCGGPGGGVERADDGDDHPRNRAAFVNANGSLTLTPAYDVCPQPSSVPQASQAMAIGGNGERSSQLSTCLAASEVYLLDAAQAKAVIDAQDEVIRPQWVTLPS